MPWAERVGLDHVRAGLKVFAVDRGDDLGLRDGEQVVVALHVARPVGEAFTAVSGLVGTVALDRRTHRTVENEDSFAQDGGELVGRVRAQVDSVGSE